MQKNWLVKGSIHSFCIAWINIHFNDLWGFLTKSHNSFIHKELKHTSCYWKYDIIYSDTCKGLKFCSLFHQQPLSLIITFNTNIELHPTCEIWTRRISTPKKVNLQLTCPWATSCKIRGDEWKIAIITSKLILYIKQTTTTDN